MVSVSLSAHILALCEDIAAVSSLFVAFARTEAILLIWSKQAIENVCHMGSFGYLFERRSS
jgi:hypothetical protein